MRGWWMVVMSVVCLVMMSCHEAINDAQHQIQIEGIEQVRQRGLSVLDLTLKISNKTDYRLVVKSLTFSLTTSESPFLTAELTDKLKVEKQFVGEVKCRFRLRNANRMAVYAWVRKVRRGKMPPTYISFSLRGRGGLLPVKISREKCEVSEFLNIFGLSKDDVLKLI